MRYGLLAYSTRNIGDEIQSLAARPFLPRVDLHVDREILNRVEGSEPLKIILNGWFAHRPENWPPAPQIRPLFVSFHITREILPLNIHRLRVLEYLLRGASLQYLCSHQPIGCRDLATVALLEAHGVEAYFSGCLTLTLENRWPQRTDDTYCVDVAESVVRFVTEQVAGPVTRPSHGAAVTETIGARFDRAERLLERYATARLVVTSRLHCALPCLALGTPVILVMQAPDIYRFSGLRELTRHYSEDDILSDRADINWQYPEPNPVNIGRLRQDLIERCSSFIRS